MTFSEAQVIAIGSRLGHLLEAIDALRSAGVRSPTLDLLEAEVHAFGRSTGATRDVRGLALHALAADMLVTIAELGPRALRGYGDLDDGATELLVRETAKLRELGSRLADELTHRGGAT